MIVSTRSERNTTMERWALYLTLSLLGLTCKAQLTKYHAIICENSGQRLYCYNNGFMNITHAMYGRRGPSLCPAGTSVMNCTASSSFPVASALCNGEHDCFLEAANSVFGDPCRGVVKYLEVDWTCVPGNDLPLISKQESVIFSDTRRGQGLGQVSFDIKLLNVSLVKTTYLIYSIEELTEPVDVNKENKTELLEWLAKPNLALPTNERCLDSSGLGQADSYFCIFEKSGIIAMNTFDPTTNFGRAFRIKIRIKIVSLSVNLYQAEVILKVINPCTLVNGVYNKMYAFCPSALKQYRYHGTFPTSPSPNFVFGIPGPMKFSSLQIDNQYTDFNSHGQPSCLFTLKINHVLGNSTQYFEYHKNLSTVIGTSTRIRVQGNPYKVRLYPPVQIKQQTGINVTFRIFYNCTGKSLQSLSFTSPEAMILQAVPFIKSSCPKETCMDIFYNWQKSYKLLSYHGRIDCLVDVRQQLAYLEPCLDSVYLTAPYNFVFGKKIEITCVEKYGFMNKKKWYHNGNLLPNTLDVLVLSGNEFNQIGEYWCETSKNRKSPSVSVVFPDVKNITVSVSIINVEYKTALKNDTSKEYQEILAPLEKEIGRVLQSTLGVKHLLIFMGFTKWNSNVLALFKVILHIPDPQKEYDQYLALRTSIRNSAQENRFGSFHTPSHLVQVRSFEFCLNETTGDAAAKGLYLWPRTPVKQSVSLACQYGPKAASVLRSCLDNTFYGASWTSYNDDSCLYLSETTNELNNLASEKITNGSASKVAKKLEVTSQNASTLSSTDTKLIGQTISNLVEANITTNEVVDSILGATSNVMDANKTSLRESQQQGGTLSKILKDIARLSVNIPTPDKPNTPIVRVSPKVAIQVVKADLSTKTALGISVKGNDLEPFKESDIEYGNTTNSDDEKISMILPDSIFDDAYVKDSRKLSFVVYKEDTLFQGVVSKDQYAYQDSIVNSMVLSVKVAGVDGFNLTTPLVGRYNHKKPVNSTGICVFWDFNARGGDGEWSNAGCRAVSYDTLSTTCHCDHLTHFAVLFDPYAGQKSTDSQHEEVLSIISYIGIGLSLFGLIMTIVTMTLFRRLRKTLPSKILVHLCLSLTLTLIVFVVGMERTEPVWACRASAALLHYFLMVTFCWMLVEAVNLYLRFVQVLGSHISKFMLKAGLLAWGLPAGLVAILCPLRLEDYGSSQLCIIHGPSAYGAVFAPILLMLLINFVIFVMVMRAVSTSSNKLTKDKKLDGKAHVRISFMCCTLVGLTWIFGAFAVSNARVVFQYLFCIFNSLQGFFIFYFHVVRQADIRNRWINYLTGNAAKYSTSSSSCRRVYGTRKDLKETHKTEIKDSAPSKGGSAPNSKDSGYQTEYNNRVYEANIKLSKV